MVDKQVSKRFEKLIKEIFGVSPLEFSKAYKDNMGVNTNNVVRGERGLSPKFLAKIKEAYPQINTTWLLKGEGSPLIGVEKETKETISPDSVILPTFAWNMIKDQSESIKQITSQMNEVIVMMKRTLDVVLRQQADCKDYMEKNYMRYENVLENYNKTIKHITN